MPRKATTGPTEVELGILRVLWATGKTGATVREVHDRMAEGAGRGGRAVGYSTTLKMMQVMLEKGLLVRDERVRPQVYRPAAGEEETQRGMLGDLIDRAFGGSARKLVMRAVQAGRISPEELGEIRKLVE